VTRESSSLIVFDLDGTLVDSRADLADACNATLVAFGHAPLDVETVTRMIGEGARVLLERAFAARQAPLPGEALDTFLQRYDEHLTVQTRPYPGVPAMVEAAARRSRLAVLTNKPQRHSDRLLDYLGLRRFMFRVVGGDGPVPRKPDPAGLLSLADEAGARVDRTLLVGDSWVDLETARRGGVGVCLARYGFGFLDIPSTHLEGTELLIDSPGELFDVLDARGL
jgi:phosphoglycolate phosphatase